MSKVENLKSNEEILTENDFFWREKDGVKILVCKPLEDFGFASGFSTRVGGVSDFPSDSLNLAGFDEDSEANIFENRRRFLNCFEGDLQLSSVWQVHGDGVKLVETQEDIKNTNDKFDALVSNLESVLIGVKTADCVPVLLGDVRTKAFAAIHAGWRGTVQSIVPKAVKLMHEKFGTEAMDLVCAIGPCATVKNYEIGNDVIDAFKTNFPNCEKLFTKTREGHALIDLQLANREQLQSVGVSNERIFTAPFCTMQRTDLFFSYRVEKKTFGKTGRLMSVIGRR